MELCLIGKKEAVIEASQRADADLLALLSEAGVTSLDDFTEARRADDENQSGKYPDPELQSTVHFMLCELVDEGNIKCRCKDGGHYEFKFVGENLDNVLIYCTECSASVSIALTDPPAIDSFLHTHSITLS